MRTGPARGFTLIELMVAAVLSSVVLLGAFFALRQVQSESARQRRSIEVVAPARKALDLIARDIRMAGDSATLFGANCLGAFRNPLATLECPAVLDAHPWRITLARNAWGLDETFTGADPLPMNTTLDGNPRNVVTYQFEPVREDDLRWGDEMRHVVLGRLVRIQNPFGFLGQEPRRTVLLENVLVDDSMRIDPVERISDPRFDHALFMFHLLGREGEFLGDAAIVNRVTSEKDLTNLSLFLTPPVSFFDPLAFVDDGLPAASAFTAYTADYGAGVVRGLYRGAGTSAQLFAESIGGAAVWSPTNPESDLRRVLDQNRIRMIRVAFKVYDPQENPRLQDGLDLDADPSNGTSPVYALESTFELRALSGDRSGF